MELLIVTVLGALVFAGALSLHMSSLNFLKTRQEIDITMAPDIALEPVTRKVGIAFEANINPARQLNLRVDQDCNGGARNTPADATDDAWWHFRLMGGRLLALCDGTATTNLLSVGSPAGTTALMAGLDTTGTGSDVNIDNPSTQGANTVVALHIVSLNPLITVDTEAALGASAKQ